MIATQFLQHRLSEDSHVGQLVTAFALKEDNFFLTEEVDEIAHGKFAFAGPRGWERCVVGARADSDAKANGHIIEQQCAVTGRGSDVHAATETGLIEYMADLTVGTGFLHAEHKRISYDVREVNAPCGGERVFVRTDELEGITGEPPQVKLRKRFVTLGDADDGNVGAMGFN